MTKYLISPSKLDAIANAVNAKTGGTTPLTLDQIAATIPTLSDDTVDKILNNTEDFEVHSNATNIRGYAFSNAKITVGDFPEALNIEGNAFSSCTRLVTLNVPKVVTIDGNAFGYCSNLTELNFPKCESIGNSAFMYCSKIAKLYAPKLQTTGSSVFRSVTNLAEVYLGADITTIGQNCFQMCSMLEKLVIDGVTSVPTLGNVAALGSTKISSGTGYIYVPDGLVSAFQAATNWSYYAAQIKGISELSA